jgi:hypothetical protein
MLDFSLRNFRESIESQKCNGGISMNVGRNDSCPCGSGKKFKKCCISKNQSTTYSAQGSLPKMLLPGASSSSPPVLPSASELKPITAPSDPSEERRKTFWNEFKSQEEEGRRAIFLRTLDDKELMTDEMAFEMLSLLHEDAVSADGKARFAELVKSLADRRPEVYQQDAHFYLSWRLDDALVGNPQEILPLARELASLAGEHLDIVNRSLRRLAYHGQLEAIVEAMRIAWPLVQSSSDILPWGITRFAEDGARYEIYNYLEHTPSPNPLSSDLIDRIKFFVAEPNEETIAEVIGDLLGQVSLALTLGDLALKPMRKKRRDDWDDEEKKDDESSDPGTQNLYRLISRFVGYLRREEGVPYTKGELVRNELFEYFTRRQEGELAPRLSMLEQAMLPNKKLPPPPKPSHPLCPERVTFDVYLSKMLGFMSELYHTASALFEIVPSWLRFLESHGLIDADQHTKTVEELSPLHADLLRLMKTNRDDPALFSSLQRWPANPLNTNTLGGPLEVSA